MSQICGDIVRLGWKGGTEEREPIGRKLVYFNNLVRGLKLGDRNTK